MKELCEVCEAEKATERFQGILDVCKRCLKLEERGQIGDLKYTEESGRY